MRRSTLALLLISMACAMAQTTIGIDVSGVPRTANLFSAYSGKVSATNAIGAVTYSSIPSVTVISGLRLNAATGDVTSSQLFATGDFGPFNFYVTDSRGNVAVSLPFYITVGDSGQRVIVTHFSEVYTCEIGVPCSIAQQACCGGNFNYNGFAAVGGQQPPGMAYAGDMNGVPSNTPMYNGTPTGPPQLYAGNQYIQMTYASSFMVHNFYSVRIVSPIRVDPTFLQPSCDVGWPFQSRIQFSGGPQVDSLRLNPSVVVSVVSGALPPGIAIVMVRISC
jgi:hypothetical protein